VPVDEHIPDQQSLGNRQISLLILRGRTNGLSDLKSLVPAALDALASIAEGRSLASADREHRRVDHQHTVNTSGKC
jgi:hypothetical protein